MKTQTRRLVDVLVVGPLLVWSGASRRGRSLPPVARAALVVSGVAKMASSWENYREQRGRERLGIDQPLVTV